MLDLLKKKNFEIIVKNHAGAILENDFPGEIKQLEETLCNLSIDARELVESGGGEAKSTQRLRNSLNEINWKKHNFSFRSYVDDTELTSITHEIDHVVKAQNGTIALEIEWNNKDPFFDRDLENFQRLHAQSVISVGIIITRGSTLQDSLFDLVEIALEKEEIEKEEDLSVFDMHERTIRQREMVRKIINRQGISYRSAFAKQFVNDKFGQATTHWRKLEDRVQRGVGNPCPLLLIGIPKDIIIV